MSAAVVTPSRAWPRAGEATERTSRAPAWLRLMWGERRLGMSSACPACLASAGRCATRDVSLGLSVHSHQRAYRFHCAACAWRSPWFEAHPDGGIDAVMLDVVMLDVP